MATAVIEDLVYISESVLDLNALVKHVNHPSAGAISTFIGITRDNFDGKKVLKLEYECYESMALTVMRNICKEVRRRHGSVDTNAKSMQAETLHGNQYKAVGIVGVAIAHRIGAVPVGEASVIIAVSSAHRRASLEMVSYAIDALKANVPIWKKEIFENNFDDSNNEEWKNNSEWNGGEIYLSLKK